jgi:Protein of unknown function (DUF2815)
MAEVKQDLTILLCNVRLSYFYGFAPYEGVDDAGKKTENYCVHGIMGPKHPDIPKLVALMKQCARNAWGDKGEQTYAELKAQNRLAIHDGTVYKPGQDGYEGNFYVSANSKMRPTIVDGDRTPLVAKDGRPYSGCYANLMVNIWAQSGGKFGKRINAQMMGVQFVGNGDAFGGGRVATPEEFPNVATDADGPAPAAQSGGDLLG